MRFRIKHNPQLGYYAQVKHGFFSGWKKIGKHNVGFGLYDEDSVSLPMETMEEAGQRCRDYKRFLKISDLNQFQYYHIDP